MGPLFKKGIIKMTKPLEKKPETKPVVKKAAVKKDVKIETPAKKAFYYKGTHYRVGSECSGLSKDDLKFLTEKGKL